VEDGLREALVRVCDGGPLLGVDAFRFDGDPAFVTAVRLRFDGGPVTFQAVAEDDTVAAEPGNDPPDDEGVWVDVSDAAGWSECVGGHAPWAWVLTNQQGYTDAVRIEFEMPDDRGPQIVEFVVVASAFHFFAARAF
jgi:hypothetical protein